MVRLINSWEASKNIIDGNRDVNMYAEWRCSLLPQSTLLDPKWHSRFTWNFTTLFLCTDKIHPVPVSIRRRRCLKFRVHIANIPTSYLQYHYIRVELENDIPGFRLFLFKIIPRAVEEFSRNSQRYILHCSKASIL